MFNTVERNAVDTEKLCIKYNLEIHLQNEVDSAYCLIVLFGQELITEGF
jgi:hypothetical protein